MLIFGPPEDGQDVEEEVDDVQLEVEGGEDVLLRAERVLVLAPEHQLGVVHKVEGEHQGTGGSVPDHGPPRQTKLNFTKLDLVA